MALIVNNEVVDIKQTVNRKNLLGMVIEAIFLTNILSFGNLKTSQRVHCTP